MRGGGFAGGMRGGGMAIGGMGGARFAGAPFAARAAFGPRFAGTPFAARAAFAPRFAGAGWRGAGWRGGPFIHRHAFFFRHHRRFAFVGAPFFYAGYYDNGCWRQTWTPYGWQWVNVCGGDYWY